MTIQKVLFLAIAGLTLSGCATIAQTPPLAPPDGPEQISVGRNPERGAYLLARERLNRVRPGMTRGAFIRQMQLRRPPSQGWYSTFSGGDGWLVELSRQNRADEELIEEYSFGYHEGRRVIERNLVILRNGSVTAIRNFRPPPDAPPFRVLSEIARADSKREENRLIRAYLAESHSSRAAFERAKPALEKVREGMTAGELRSLLSGHFYRFRRGYVYFADGFLWGPRFESVETSTGSLTLMPFGYVEGGKEVVRVLIKIVDGVVTEKTRKPEKVGKLSARRSSDSRDARPRPAGPPPSPPSPPSAGPRAHGETDPGASGTPVPLE